MSIWNKIFVLFIAACLFGISAHGQDTGAVISGNWEDPTIWTAGTVPGSANNVYIGSTFPSGAASIATVTLTANESAANLFLGSGNNTHGTLNLAGHTLTIVDTFTIGQNGGIGTLNEGGGSFTAGTLNLESASTFTFGTNDAVSALNVFSGSTAATTAGGNVTGNLNVLSGSTLNLGANLSLTGSLDVENTGSVVHMNGFNINAPTILLGQFGNQAVTLDRGATPGSLSATDLYIAQITLNLLPSDNVTNFHLNHSTTTLNSGVAVSFLDLINASTATTTTAGNVTGLVNVHDGSTMNLGANLNLTGDLDVNGAGSILKGHGFNLNLHQLTVGFFGPGTATVSDVGTANLFSLFMGHGSSMTIDGGTVSSSINLGGGSILNVVETGGTGLTLNGAFNGALSIDSSSMELIFNSSGWDFRWQDPSSGGNWVSTLDAMIAAGQIDISLPMGGSYSVFDLNGYTYIGASVTAVPEASSLTIASIACVGLAIGMRWRNCRAGR